MAETYRNLRKNRVKPTAIAHEVLAREPTLTRDIQNTFGQLAALGLPVPCLHFTPRSIKHGDEEQSTGFVESIRKDGLRKSSHVGIMLKEEGARSPAQPQDIQNNPHLYVLELISCLRDCGKHGTRVNREHHEQHRDRGIGQPSVILFNRTSVPCATMNDHQRHFMTKDVVDPSMIISDTPIDGKLIMQAESLKTVFQTRQEEEFYNSVVGLAHSQLDAIREWIKSRKTVLDSRLDSTSRETRSILSDSAA